MKLALASLRAGNILRLPQFKNSKGEPAHSEPDGSDWSLNDWMTAALGELGECANVLKKVRRGDLTLEEARPKIMQEIADTIIYADILAMQCSISLDEAVLKTFNNKSKQVGADVFLEYEEVREAELCSS